MGAPPERPLERPEEPPSLALALLRAATAKQMRDALIGDLVEQYDDRATTGSSGANAWFWRQTLFSAPPLLLMRMNSSAAGKAGLLIALVLGAIVFTRYWDLLVARNAAQQFYQIVKPEGFTPARIVYFGVQAFGYALAGAAAYAALNAQRRPLLSFILFPMTPVFFAISAPALFDLFAGERTYPASIRLLQLALAGSAMIAGACAAALIDRKRR